MLSRQCLIVSLIAALLGAAVAVPTASAHNATIQSQHSLSLNAGVLTGQLSSTESDCLGGREITLHEVGDVGFVQVSTDASGRWTRYATGWQGSDVYAVAASKFVKRPGHKHTCASATSNTVTVPQDADGDGYTEALGDCNDANPAVNPGATEVLNRVDDDCDGWVDEGFETAPRMCWVPSSEPVTATTTWSQVELSEPCTWEPYRFTIVPEPVYMVSYDWMIEYVPAAAGDPVAFQYDGQDWTYYATHSNCCGSGA